MARVEVAMQAWGYVVDTRGRPRSGQLCEINTPVYVAAAGATEISDPNFLTDDEGYLPGFVEQGTYTFTDPDGDSWQVEAASGVGGGPQGDPGPAGPAGVPDGWFDVTAYGAVGDGATDCTTAIQDAVDDARASGGTVYFPINAAATTTIYNISATIDVSFLSGNRGIRLCGPAGGVGQINSTHPTIMYKTGDANAILDFRSNFNFELDHLRVAYDDGAYTGNMIDLDGHTHASGGDTTNFQIHHVVTRGFTGLSNTHLLSATSSVRMNKTIIGSIAHSHFSGAVNQILVGDLTGIPAQSAYVVGVHIDNCTFNASDDAHILVDTADAESVSVKDCVFEAGIDTTAIRGTTSNRMYNPVIANNWFGDAGTDTIWIDGLETQSNGFTGMIYGNRMASVHSGGIHLNLEGKWIVMGNSMEDGTVYASASPTNLRITDIGNMYNGVTAIFDATDWPTGYPLNYVKLDPGTNGTILDEQVGIHGSQAAITAPLGSEKVVLGVQANAGFATALLGARAGAMFSGLDGSRDALFIQGPEGGGSEGDVVLVTNDNAGAFQRILTLRSGGAWAFGASTTPAVPATYTTTNGTTDRSFDADTVATPELADVVHTLISDLRAKGIVL